MRLAYGDSNVLKCNVQFAYDRFFTSFSDKDGGVPVTTGDLVNKSDDINKTLINSAIERNTLVDDITLGGTVPYQSTGFA